jgi:hypothetical protein
MSNKLIADLMSFRARMVADNRTQVMFEGDFDTIDQVIATLRKAHLAAPQQAIPSGWNDPNDKTQAKYLPWIGEKCLFTFGGKVFYGHHTGGSFQSFSPPKLFPTWECLWQELPTAPIERDK